MKTQNTENKNVEPHEAMKTVMTAPMVKLTGQKNSLQNTHSPLMETIEFPLEEQGIPLP